MGGDDGFYFRRHGLELVGRGEATRLELNHEATSLRSSLQEVIESLRSINAPRGVNPLAFVCIPFAPTRPILAVIPTFTMILTNEDESMVTVGDTSLFEYDERWGKPRPAGPTPNTAVVRAERSAGAFRRDVLRAIHEISNWEAPRHLQKIVLARQLELHADTEFSPTTVLRNFHNSSGSYGFAIDGFVGSSPELLVSRHHDRFVSEPKAGTRVLGTHARGLEKSAKERIEHAMVVEEIWNALDSFTEGTLRIPAFPHTMAAANVEHLSTSITGRLRGSGFINGEFYRGHPTVLDLVAALHPTPAVGGIPTAAARQAIPQFENIDRGRYAGAVGWVNAVGDGEFAVALRCAQLEGNVARLHAGAGITELSDPDEELAEVDAKFRPALEACLGPDLAKRLEVSQALDGSRGRH
jgi:menaquinone-specific isochorismate synthase